MKVEYQQNKSYSIFVLWEPYTCPLFIRIHPAWTKVVHWLSLIPKLGTYWLLSMKAHGMCTALLFSQREFGPVNSLRKEAISQWNSTGTPTRQVVELCRPSACSGHYLPNPLLGKKNIRIEVFCNSLCCSYFRWKTWNFYPTAALCLAVWSLCRLQLCWQGWPSNKAQINGTEGWTGAVITQTFPA